LLVMTRYIFLTDCLCCHSPAKQTDETKLVMRFEVDCASSMEPTYFGCSFFDNTACFYCGKVGSAVNKDIVATTVYPLCDGCIRKGLIDHTYGEKSRPKAQNGDYF